MFSVDFLCCAFLDFPVSRSFSMPNEGGGRPALEEESNCKRTEARNLFWLVGKFRVSRVYLGGGFIL